MAVFMVTAPISSVDHQAALEAALSVYEKKLQLGAGQWLVASKGTVQSVSMELKLLGTTERLPIHQFPTLVIQVAAYTGRAYPDWWNWIKTNWEATDG